MILSDVNRVQVFRRVTVTLNYNAYEHTSVHVGEGTQILLSTVLDPSAL